MLDDLWDLLVWFCLHKVTRYVASWLLALVALGGVFDSAWKSFAHDHRPNGNDGHTTIDFGGQWLMGAMLVEGHGKELYNRNYQWNVLQNAFPRHMEPPDALKTDDEKTGDAESLMSWVMGEDNGKASPITASCCIPLAATHAPGAIMLVAAGQESWTPDRLQTVQEKHVGGPLYPPINALYFAPLGALEPPLAYRINQGMALVWAILAGWGVSVLTRGKIWCPIAASLIVIYPGFSGSIHLGQNAPLTLCILIWGWALLSRDKEIAGGMVWGLLAYKPVWAMAFFLVPLVTGRWRFCLSMLGMGALLALITIPLVGIHSWFDWLEVGREAAGVYNRDENWIFLSRDLLSVPRRWLLDFSASYYERGESLEVALVGWVLLLACLEVTVMLAALRRGQARQTTGAPAAFLLFGAWLTCYHFMYYDALLSVFPFLVLCAEPRRLLQPILLTFTILPGQNLGREVAEFYGPLPADDYPPPVPLVQLGYQHLWVLNRLELNVLVLIIALEHFHNDLAMGVSLAGFWSPNTLEVTTIMRGYVLPWDTFLVAVLWLYSGFLWLRLKHTTSAGIPVMPLEQLLENEEEPDVELEVAGEAAIEPPETSAHE